MNDEKLLNQRFEFKKDEPVQETVDSPESGTTEEYTFLGWWDCDKFQLHERSIKRYKRNCTVQSNAT